MSNADEYKACTPVPVKPDRFNPNCSLPYGLTVEHVRRAMEDFIRLVAHLRILTF